jgi:cystathionine beta-synthase
VFEGVATLGSLKAGVLKGKVMPTDAVDNAAYHTFKKVTLDTTLEKLDRILDKEHFALVVHSQRLFKSPKDVQNKEVVVGLVTDMDLLDYVTQNETSKLTSISENNSTNSGNATPENLD